MRYPLLLKPVLKDYIWGGERLKKEFGFKADTQTVAEGWMLACHKDGTNVILNGNYAGEPLSKALCEWGYGSDFPILIKLLDACDRLSVQVHPDNDYALKNEGEHSKTEMWYIADCDEGATLAYGFKRDINTNEFRHRILNNTLDQVINYVPVKKGDVFFIEAGTLHAVGAGILIAEIQQNSNSTYRISDYGRLGKDGKPRELHVDKAVDVTKTKKPDAPYGNIGKTTVFNFGKERLLAECEYFKTVKIDLDGQKNIFCAKGFVSLLILEGELTVCYNSQKFTAKKGDSIFVPNNCSCTVFGKAEIIYTE